MLRVAAAFLIPPALAITFMCMLSPLDNHARLQQIYTQGQFIVASVIAGSGLPWLIGIRNNQTLKAKQPA